MKIRIIFLAFVIFLFSMILSGCGQNGLFGPTFTPTSSPTSTRTMTPTHNPVDFMFGGRKIIIFSIKRMGSKTVQEDWILATGKGIEVSGVIGQSFSAKAYEENKELLVINLSGGNINETIATNITVYDENNHISQLGIFGEEVWIFAINKSSKNFLLHLSEKQIIELGTFL